MKKSWREKILDHVRELRKNQTAHEQKLWQLLRNRQFEGKKFLRQHPIVHYCYKRPYYFVADFYCAEHKLVIELDGAVHQYQEEYDQQRDLILNAKGLTILRIKNEELTEINTVKEKIRKQLK